MGFLKLTINLNDGMFLKKYLRASSIFHKKMPGNVNQAAATFHSGVKYFFC